MNKSFDEFWNHLRSGVQVAVASNLPDKLLGVRDGFQRYFHDGREKPVEVVVHPRKGKEPSPPLPLRDEDILTLARKQARDEQNARGADHDFVVGTEAGLFTIRCDGETRHFVRSWTVLLGLGDEAWGSSGGVQLPSRLLKGLDEAEIPFAVPGTLRGGGMVSSLTGGLESRRSATAQATLHALSTLLYGLLESRPVRKR